MCRRIIEPKNYVKYVFIEEMNGNLNNENSVLLMAYNPVGY
jgi:hypothetical protein